MITNGNASGPVHPGSFDEGIQLRDLINLLRRNALLILLIAGAVIGGTVLYLVKAPPLFQAQATIHVEQDRSTPPDLEFLSAALRGSDVETEMALIRARTLAEGAVDALSLQAQVVEPVGISRAGLFSEIEASRATQSESYTFERQPDGRYRITDGAGREVAVVRRGEVTLFNGLRLALTEVDPTPPGRSDFPGTIELQVHSFYEAVADLSDRLSVGRPWRDASVIGVTYTGRDPNLVRDIPNTLSELYIERRRESKKTEATSTVEFLRSQIDTYTDQLRLAEDNLLAFQQGEQVVNLEAEGAEQVRRLVDAQAQRDDLEAEISSLDELFRQIEGARSGEDEEAARDAFRRLAGFPTFLRNQAVTELMSNLNRLEADLTEMATRRTATHPDMVGLRTAVQQHESRLYQLARNYRTSLANQLESVQSNMDRFGGQLELIPEKAVQEARLTRQKTVLEQVFTLLQSRLKEAEIAQAVEPGDVTIVDAAILPVRPIRPRKFRSLILSIVFGFTLGVGVAAARDRLDATVHTRDEMSKVTNLPVLATIPRIKGAARNGADRLLRRKQDESDRLVTRSDMGNPVSEAYRAFRTNITFLDLENPPRALVITSPGRAEGKSTSAANLAITLAQQSTRTLIVDCDLRRGVVHKVFGLGKPKPGLTNVLLKEATLEEAVREVDIGNGRTLHVLPTGTFPPNPSELLGSKPMRDLLAQLREKYDMVLLDSPPLNLVTDAAVLGAEADGVILIARAGATNKHALRYAVDQLTAVKARISGTVLNDLDYQGRGRYYGYGYGYYHRYYGPDKNGA